MRLSGYKRDSATRFDSQMTPMIDVVFQLLIFFVCTVNFQKQEQSLAATPRAAAKQAGGGGAVAERPPPELEDLQQVELKIIRNNDKTQWTVNGGICRTFNDVAGRLTALAKLPTYKSIVPVVLDVADDVPMADAIEAYDLCLKLGFQKVQFVSPE